MLVGQGALHASEEVEEVAEILGTGVAKALLGKAVLSDDLPEEGKARGVQIDISGKRVGFRFLAEVNLGGDSKETLRALVPLLERKEDRSWRERIELGVKRWWKVIEGRAMNPAHPLNPQRVLYSDSQND